MLMENDLQHGPGALDCQGLVLSRLMRLPPIMEPTFAREYLVDFDIANAARRCGISKSPLAFGRAMMRRESVQQIIVREIAERRVRLQIDADYVLQQLLAQLGRLLLMSNRSIKDIYASDGTLRPIEEWPEIWLERLVTEIHSQDTYELSSDGVIAGERRSWDKSGRITKVKRESTLAIEREIRLTLAEIGRHVNVRAFPVPGEKIGEGLEAVAGAIDRAIAEGRQRAARLGKHE